MSDAPKEPAQDEVREEIEYLYRESDLCAENLRLAKCITADEAICLKRHGEQLAALCRREHEARVEAERRRACPCQHTTPCHPNCTCIKPYSSRGCDRCCSYGSDEQRVAAAEHLAAAKAMPSCCGHAPDHVHQEVGRLQEALDTMTRTAEEWRARALAESDLAAAKARIEELERRAADCICEKVTNAS